MTYPISGINSLSTKFLTNKTIAGQLYARSALLYALMGMSQGVPDLLSIGAPSGAVFSGAPVNYAEKMTLPTQKSYAPRIQSSKVNSTAVVGQRGTTVNVLSGTTNQAVVQENNAIFNMFKYEQTQGLIYQSDLDDAVDGKSDEGQGLAVGQLTLNAMEIMRSDHIESWTSRLLYGQPTLPLAYPADDLSGVIFAASATGSYGGVDRSGLSAGDPWLPAQPIDGTGYPVAFPKDIYQIVNDANYTRGMITYGGGANLVLCGSVNYLVFKQQVMNRDRTMVMSDGFPGMAKAGISKEVLRVDNTYVMHEPYLDVCYGKNTAGSALYTAQPTYVLVMNLKVWKLIMMKKYNMQLTPWNNLANQALGAPMAIQAFLTSGGILSCDRPGVGISLYSGLV